MSVMDVAYDAGKFSEMVLHVAGRLQDDSAGGATKLNKVLFFAEFTHLRRHHRVISGCETATSERVSESVAERYNLATA